MPDDSNYYKTIIKNIGSQKCKIVRFGGFEKSSNGNYLLHTITNDFFSAVDFRNWYMDNDEEWIYPGQTVSDPINYGIQNNWAYQVEVENGNTFWISTLH